MQKKKGISLIVLIITIIVMIILAGTIILSLNNSGIIGKAQDAVDATNLNEVKNLANVAWAEAYINGARTEAELSAAVEEALTKNNITEDKYKGYTIIVTTNGVDFADKALNPSGVIPEGGVYYVGVPDAGGYAGATATYTAGDSFPTTVTTGDVYVYGDYIYYYNQSSAGFDETLDGWSVMVIDYNKTTYDLILQTINGEYIKSMCETFYGCTSLTELPEGFTIPSGVIDMDYTFNECSSLEKLPQGFTIPKGVINLTGTFAYCGLTELPEGFTIPNGVTNMTETFVYCESLTKLPDGFTIPNSVINMRATFEGTAITKLPDSFVIPSSVKCMSWTFMDCNSLTGTITINANPTEYDACFGSCDMSKITLAGSSSMLETLKETAE